MAQVTKGSPDLRAQGWSNLAETLGMGIGQKINSHYAGKALDEVLNNPENSNKPQSEKMGLLQKALQPYGKTGEQLLKGRMEIEKQAKEERQEKVNQKKGDILRRRLAGEEVSEKDMGLFTPEEELAIAKHQQALPLQELKNQGKNPPGGITAQPIPPEIQSKMSNIINNSQGISADQLKLEMDRQGIPPVYSNPFIESRRQETKPTFEPESEKLEAKRVAETASQVEKDYFTSKNEDLRLDRMLKLKKEGNLSTPAMVKTLDALGIPLGILGNPDTEEYRKLETDFISNVRDLFPRGAITGYEISSYLKTIPSLMNSPEGQEVIIRNRQLMNEAKQVRYDEYKKILKENGGKKPQNLGIILEERTADRINDIEQRFKAGIEKEIEKFQQPIRMIGPDGKPYDIPPNLIEKAMKSGAKFG